MAVYAGPDIVEDGLVLCLDAANSRSYPLVGATWTNLTQFNTASLINGPTFSNLYGGGIVNDNFNDYIDTNFTMSVSNFTICIWAQLTSNSFWSILWGSDFWNNSTGYAGYFQDANTLVFQRANSQSIVGTVTNTNLPSMYAFSLTSSNSAKLYQNGILINSGTITVATSIERTIKLNSRNSNDGTSTSDMQMGNIYSFNYYNRVLSDQEILQNFNAHRRRFNI